MFELVDCIGVVDVTVDFFLVLSLLRNVIEEAEERAECTLCGGWCF